MATNYSAHRRYGGKIDYMVLSPITETPVGYVQDGPGQDWIVSNFVDPTLSGMRFDRRMDAIDWLSRWAASQGV